MRASRRALATVVLALAATPAGATASPQLGSIEGTVVTDAGRPLDGVTVEVMAGEEEPTADDVPIAVAVTAADGTYGVDDLDAARSPYYVRFERDGHEPRYWGERPVEPPVVSWMPSSGPGIAANVWLPGGGTTTTVDMSLRPLDATVRGRVTDGEGRPVSGARVDAVEGRQWTDWGRRHPTTTDVDGRYALRVPASEYVVRADRADLVTRWTGPTGAPHVHASAWEAGWVTARAGVPADGVDFTLLARPARSCWGAGSPYDGRRTMIWVVGTADRPEPSFPPHADDACGAPHAPAPVSPANVGRFSVGDQQMDIREMLAAHGREDGSPPMVIDRPGAEEQRMLDWLDAARPTVAELSKVMAPEEIVFWIATLTGAVPDGLTAPSAPAAPAPAAATKPKTAAPTLRTRRAIGVRGRRFTVDARCRSGRSCAGTIRVTARRPATAGRRARTVTVGTARVRTSRKVRVRLTGAGRALLRDRRTVRASLSWTATRSKRSTRIGAVRLREVR
ncbi:MAG: carboxypeptidase-like regulatory domain-containing protein [Solirubrobacteraceae bacterium]|nr:carboxypeptidase-like regulatory domain-containing protein [Solirubrobacteraceae bacterium]